MILFVGDIHGKTFAAKQIDAYAKKIGATAIIQTGDFGLLWGGPNDDFEEEFFTYFYTREPSLPVWYTCAGNHDNWDALKAKADIQGNADVVELAPNCFWVQRGKFLNIEGKKILFFGGAESIDKYHRTEGISWWAQETPSYKEFEDFFSALDEGKPDIVITHDAPKSIDIWRIDNRESVTPKSLQKIFELTSHRPKAWLFGHHHILEEWNVDGTAFYCCGIEGEGWEYHLEDDSFHSFDDKLINSI